MTTNESIQSAIERDGAIVIKGVFDNHTVSELSTALRRAIDLEAKYHGGTAYQDYGMVLLCALYDPIFREICGWERLMRPFEAVMGEGCIIYAYTSSSMPPNNVNYSARIHVDCPRLIPGYVTNMGATIALSDFTVQNGATWYMCGSHRTKTCPAEDVFYSTAKRFIAPAGSVLYFNARIWHAGGRNSTDQWRHGLTINMSRPWMKQRIDIPRALSDIDTAGLTEKARQKLGFFARVPASYDEYYAPPELRTFKQKAE